MGGEHATEREPEHTLTLPTPLNRSIYNEVILPLMEGWRQREVWRETRKALYVFSPGVCCRFHRSLRHIFHRFLLIFNSLDISTTVQLDFVPSYLRLNEDL